jgi:hypothetical protein
MTGIRLIVRLIIHIVIYVTLTKPVKEAKARLWAAVSLMMMKMDDDNSNKIEFALTVFFDYPGPCFPHLPWIIGTLLYIYLLSEISGSHGGEYEADCLLGCWAV